MARDPYDQILSILEDNWNPSNTDDFTPTFAKLTNLKSIDYRKSKDWILLQRSRGNIKAGGIGMTVYHEYQTFNLDIRCYGTADIEDHFQSVIHEVQRVLEENFNLFGDTTNDYDLIDADGDKIDMSDETFNIYRVLVPVKLIKLSVQRGT